MESSRKDFEEIAKGKWQWKSNPDPWSKSEEPQWVSYSMEHNYLIEKAYYDQKKEVDIGDYIVSIQHMLQKKKGSVISQRPIRRVNHGDSFQEMDRSERYFETELPKTINKVFGSLWDFIAFFSRRNPEILDFTSHFEEIEKSKDLDGLNHKIIPKVICCLEEELLKPISEKLTEDLELSVFQKKALLQRKGRHEELMSLFKKEFSSFEEFYGCVLRAYTMNTDLYLNLNRYLRNESWIEVDNLLPYAFCLCKAFSNLKLRNNEIIPEEAKSITLYRGTAFDEHSLSLYDVQKTRHFSWNSVTSTSTRKDVAEKFMYKSADLRNKRYPVLFVIELSTAVNNLMESDYLKWIDIHQYSAMPQEDEVILAPGSVFELLECETDQDKRTTIQIRLKNEVKSLAHAGLIMAGAFQSEMMTDREVKILCLEGEELHDALKCLTKNKLIEEVEFCLCIFDNRSLEIMMEVLSTLERAKSLRFISCSYRDKERKPKGISIEMKMWNPGISKVEIFEMNDFYKLFTIANEEDKSWESLREFSINFRKKGSSKMDNQWLQGLKHLTQLQCLTLDFSKNEQITNKGLHNFAFNGLSHLTQLMSLTLDFSGCPDIADKGLHSLASQGLRHLTQLTSLTLSFSSCDKVTDKGMRNLATDGLLHLTQLSSLTLDFSYCDEITDKSLRSLCSEGIKHLACLTSLALDFSGCSQITDEGLRGLTEEEPKRLILLTSRDNDGKELRFSANSSHEKLWPQGTPPPSKKRKLDFKRDFDKHKGLFPTFISEGPFSLKFSQSSETFLNRHLLEITASSPSTACVSENFSQLISLTLRFRDDTQITDQGIHHLASEGLKKLHQLTSLTLDFSYCKQITDEGVNSITSQGLQNLTQLRDLSLDFSYCDQITNQGVSKLASEGLKYLNQLSVLTFNSQWCQKITNEGLQNLATGALKHLFQLTLLTLDFSGCREITDEGISHITAQGIRKLTQLASLTLNFKWCHQITDEGIRSLASEGLKHLLQLKSLALDFSYCLQITDEGVNSVTSQGLRHLIRLTSLTLDFKKCHQVTKFTLSNIIRVLRYFGFSVILNPSSLGEAMNSEKSSTQFNRELVEFY